MKSIDQARYAAVKIVNRVLREGAYSNIAVKEELDSGRLGRLDKALITEIANGTLRNLSRIDWIKSQFVKTSKIESWIEDIIRCGIYQLLFLDRVPDSAVCNESAEIARKHSNEGAVKFVNGVLRNISRNKEKLEYPDKEKDAVKFLSVFYSHPEWMVKKWVKDYGRDFTEDLLKANNETPAFTIRCNSLRLNRQELMLLLSEEGMECEAGKYNSEAVYIRGTSAIEEKESFKKGFYQVQDESSMLVAHVVNPEPGETILDMCSAPGGKATHMAQIMKNEGKIISFDIHSHKLRLIKENAERLGIDIINEKLKDSAVYDDSLKDSADKVLVDAPCSGLGLIRKKPEIKWNIKPDDLNSLSDIQRSILLNASRYVKPGGNIVYSTCTITKEENEEIVEWFLNENRNFEFENISSRVPGKFITDTCNRGYIKLFSNIHDTDGFFIAKFRRK
jgi:16S rRNA (cytosine967-C5)-methyltransferase